MGCVEARLRRALRRRRPRGRARGARGPVPSSGSLTAAEDDALALVAALNRRDWDAYTAFLSPDFVAIDHSPLGFPPAGRAEFVREQIQGLVALVPDAVVIPQALVSGDAVLMAFRTIGTTVDGEPLRVDADLRRSWRRRTGRTAEAFPAEEWDAALARFDELAAAAPEPAASTADSRILSNHAVRCAHAYDDAYAAQTGIASPRRTTTTSSTTTGARRSARASRPDGTGCWISFAGWSTSGSRPSRRSPIAVRGEALALVQPTFETESGDRLELVAVIEYDEQDRMTANVMFDLDDRAAALQELEDRYCAGEGAADAYLIRRAGDFVRSMAAPDGAATLALVHPDVRFTDHRRLGLGDDGLRRRTRRPRRPCRAHRRGHGRTSRDLAVRGSTTMGLLVSAGIGPDGDVEALYEFHWVTRWVRGEDARHRLVRPGRPRRGPRPVRGARRRGSAHTARRQRRRCASWSRGTWRQEFDPTYDAQAELNAQNAADVVVDDRRRGVSIGVLHGHDEMDENIRAQDDLFGPTTFDPIAVRGERLALARTRAVAPSGFELVSLGVFEADAEGRFSSLTFFDESDLVAALEELEQRHRELSGDAYPPNERLFVERSIAYQHGRPRHDARLLGSGLPGRRPHAGRVRHADAAGLRAQIDAQDAQVPTVAIQAKRYVSERAILERPRTAARPMTATTTSGRTPPSRASTATGASPPTTASRSSSGTRRSRSSTNGPAALRIPADIAVPL